MSGLERRAAPRYPVRLSAEVTRAGRTSTTRTRDLSEGGVCLQYDQPVAAGTPLAIGLFLVADDIEDSTVPALPLRGVVAWSTPPRGEEPALVGVRFDALSVALKSSLQRFFQLLRTP